VVKTSIVIRCGGELGVAGRLGLAVGVNTSIHSYVLT